MQNQLIKINSMDLQIKEYQGKRVCTLKDIDTVHKRPESTARQSFQRNKKHFIECEDYYRIDSDKSLSMFNIRTPKTGLTLITESGYLMLVKSFTDDLAWDVQRQLVNNYFRKPEPKVPTVQMPPIKTRLQLLDELYIRALKEADKCADLKKSHYDLYRDHESLYRKYLEYENSWRKELGRVKQLMASECVKDAADMLREFGEV